MHWPNVKLGLWDRLGSHQRQRREQIPQSQHWQFEQQDLGKRCKWWYCQWLLDDDRQCLSSLDKVKLNILVLTHSFSVQKPSIDWTCLCQSILRFDESCVRIRRPTVCNRSCLRRLANCSHKLRCLHELRLCESIHLGQRGSRQKSRLGNFRWARHRPVHNHYQCYHILLGWLTRIHTYCPVSLQSLIATYWLIKHSFHESSTDSKYLGAWKICLLEWHRCHTRPQP